MGSQHHLPPFQRPYRTRTAVLAASAASMLALLAACGSTVSLTGSAATQSNLEAGSLGLTTGDGTNSQAPVTAQRSDPSQDLPSSAPAPASALSSGPTSATVATTTAGSPSSPAVLPPGPVEVGIAYVNASEGNAFSSAISGGLKSGDDHANFEILINDINAHGGILGHQVDPIFYEISTSQTVATAGQAACTDFTQDHHVRFIFNTSYIPLVDCVEKAGAAAVGPDQTNLSAADLAKEPYLFMPDTMPMDTLAMVQASQFSAMGLFQGNAKVGILYTQQPQEERAEKVLESQLKQRGVTAADSFGVTPVNSTSDAGSAIADDKAAALRFKAEGVTVVLGVETGSWGMGFFGVNAASQGYYPKLGITSEEAPTAMQAAVPAKELKKAVFIGWLPTQDTDDTSVFPAAAKACLSLIAKGGQPLSVAGQRQSAMNDCEAADFLKAALTKGDGLTPAALKAGAKELGTSYPSVATWGVDLANGNGAGAHEVRRGAWDDSCSCFAYTSKTFPID